MAEREEAADAAHPSASVVARQPVAEVDTPGG